MNEFKQNLIDRINKLSDDLTEMQIIERLYMMSRLEYSKK